MPTYQHWGTSAQARLPLTPPECPSSYLGPMTDEMQNFYPPQNYMARLPHSAREYNDQYHRLPPFSSHSSLPPQLHGRSKNLYNNHDYNMGYTHQLTAPYHYAPVQAPMLPPIRATEDLSNFTSHYSQSVIEPKPKEEKPTGGVAQHLDYEMAMMASFVAEMSQRIVTHTSSPTPQFRKYVSQILSSTRLPSSTIMLGLFYLQERMRLLSKRGEQTSTSGTVYRMLTTCLLLGSKFLDDNTFQNRSWAEVSSIPVAELNMMELDWLKDFNWEIHGLMYEKDEGFFVWVDHWHTYKAKAQMAKTAELQTLAPIETNFPRQHVISRPLMSPEGPIPAQYQHGAQYDTQWVRPFMSEYSPLSGADSGATTPEYYGHNWMYSQAPQSYARASWNSGLANYGTHRSINGYSTPYSAQPYGQPTWIGHGANCGCTLCAKHSDYYFNHGYSAQTVAG